MEACRASRFPVTIVRPSHTYDCRLLPMHGGYTVIDRMRNGAPVIVHGDGTSGWTLTHHRDFAKGFVGLLGRDDAVGEAFHITSDEWLTWDRINRILARAAGASAEIVHVPSDIIRRYDPAWGASLLGDKTHSKIFDNSKIKRLRPRLRGDDPVFSGRRRDHRLARRRFHAPDGRSRARPHDGPDHRRLATFLPRLTRDHRLATDLHRFPVWRAESPNSRSYIAGMTSPPHTGMKAPVMNPARSEARKATAFATS